ncbi:unnamed protein product [Caenorhabditis angaria]|uniref:Uncharacterized protein n=1 Tax=Caenorhabditis angaria TaxID=860376 RepID=A0A9P1IU47_9PELO|nr:unnamed protein product [Caenorhabditis angaria]
MGPFIFEKLQSSTLLMTENLQGFPIDPSWKRIEILKHFESLGDVRFKKFEFTVPEVKNVYFKVTENGTIDRTRMAFEIEYYLNIGKVRSVVITRFSEKFNCYKIYHHIRLCIYGGKPDCGNIYGIRMHLKILMDKLKTIPSFVLENIY